MSTGAVTTSRLRAPVTSRDHVAGTDSALVTLVEYGDYQCPSCREAHGVVEALQQRLGDGLRFVFRNFPRMAAHRQALVAAEAAEAAGAQGRFWPMHDLLYAHQDALELAQLVGHAARIGLDLDAFEHDVVTHRLLARVRADLRAGGDSGVDRTPTFFINDVRHDGGFDFDSLWSAIAGAGGVEVGA